MNCEQVEELLSAYLDNALALEERLAVATHLQGCSHCSTILADFQRLDALLSQQPRVSPDPALRNRIFSSSEYLELTGTFDSSIGHSHDTGSRRSIRRDTPGRPQLVAIPGGRSRSSSELEPPSLEQHPAMLPIRRRRSNWGLRVMQVAIAAIILLTIGVGGLIGWNIWSQQAHTGITAGAITPPAGGPQQAGPLPAGMRFVFLRGGTLWSAPADGSTQIRRLTADAITVAANWVVSPALPGRAAGDRLAYIDLQKALLHTIRSDGQSDTIISQALLKTGVQPSSVWDTDTGMAILNSLAWSKDGSMLAFVADPKGTGLTNLYIASMDTGTVQMVPVPIKGSASHPVWSPDGVRLAFQLSYDGGVSILDYNTQNHGLLTITDSSTSDTLLDLDWSPDVNAPAITWSMGVIGHVHSIWIRHVGAGGATEPQLLTTGDYAQAIYSRMGHGGVGSWLLLTSMAGRPADLWRLDVPPRTGLVRLTAGKQVSFAQWSPDGTQVDYFDAISAGVGAFHVVNVTTGIDTLIASSVADEPAPAWSVDSQQLAYSTGKQTVVVNVQASKKTFSLKLRGSASALIWSATSPHQLVVALSDGQQGIYLVDTQQNTSLQLDKQDISGPIEWTEIP